MPKWIKKEHLRPTKIEDATDVVPPGVASPVPTLVDKAIGFESLEAALRMEAAFYLERQFFHAGKHSSKHWYDFSLDQMIHLLVSSVVA